MARNSKKTASVKTDIYQRITDLILEKLSGGVIPWRKPVSIAQVNGQTHFRPVNVETGKAYAGINALVLACSPYDLPVFGTFKQIQALGGMVKKGAKSLPVIYWQKTKPKDAGQDEEKKGGFILKYYNVFNILETDLDASVFRIGATQAPEVLPETRKIPACETIIEGYQNGPLLVHRDQTRMSYSILTDVVNMPDQVRFEHPEEYYHILFHELTHSTRHPSRLNRGTGVPNAFGGADYSQEELTAELGAAFLASVAGISSESTIDGSAAYLKGWFSALKNDKMLLFKASGEAKKATEWILGEAPAQAA